MPNITIISRVFTQEVCTQKQVRGANSASAATTSTMTAMYFPMKSLTLLTPDAPVFNSDVITD